MVPIKTKKNKKNAFYLHFYDKNRNKKYIILTKAFDIIHTRNIKKDNFNNTYEQ